MNLIEKIKKNQIIVHKGKKVGFVARVKSGGVGVYSLLNNREICLPETNIFEQWSAMMVLTGKISQFEIRTITEVELEKIESKAYLESLKNNPTKLIELSKNLSELFLDQAKLWSEIVGASADGKVAAIILSWVNNKVPLTHKMIANLTGLTRETVTLQMLKLEKMKLIDNESRKVKILNKAGLEKLI